MNCIIFMNITQFMNIIPAYIQRPRMRILHRRLISRAYRLAPETINQLKHRLRSCTTGNIARGECREANTAQGELVYITLSLFSPLNFALMYKVAQTLK